MDRPFRYRCQCLMLHGAGDLRMEEQPVSEPGPGEVIVDVAMGGICGSDLHYMRHGGFGAIRLREPMVLGHEVAGRVAALGEGVDWLAVGDRVAVNPSRPCRACRYCLEGLPNQCLDMRFYGSAMRMPHVQGAFRDRLLCDAVQCEPVAAHVPDAWAAMAEPFAVALHAVSRAGPLLGRRVLVTGSGPIGALAVVAARLHGALEVVATDVVDEALARVREAGAHRTINVAADPAWTEPLKVDKGTFDVLIECSGQAQALRDGLDVVRPRGTVVQLGLGGDVALPQNVVVAKEIALVGSFRFHAEFALAVQLLNDRRVDFGPLVSHVFPAREADRAFAVAADRRQSMKVLLDFAAL